MKTLQSTMLAIVLIAITSSCQAPSDAKQLVSNDETRKEIIDAIANNTEMSQEMMTAMMQNKDRKMMRKHHKSMVGMMKDDSTMMNGMMKDMMHASKSDTSMMSSMCRTMMDDKEMMDRMEMMKKRKAIGQIGK